jgi:hypothetical protein
LQGRVKAGKNLPEVVGWRLRRPSRRNLIGGLFATATRYGLLAHTSREAFAFQPGINRIQHAIAELPAGQRFFDEQAGTAKQKPQRQQRIQGQEQDAGQGMDQGFDHGWDEVRIGILPGPNSPGLSA